MASIDDLERHLTAAVTAQAQLVLTQMQADLGSRRVSPYDTGRFRSSWFASEGERSSAVAAENANSPNTDAVGLRIQPGRTYYLTNSLPYASVVAVEGRVVSQPTTWWQDWLRSRVPRIIAAAERRVRQDYRL